MAVAQDQVLKLFDLMNLDGEKCVKYNHFVVFVCDPHHEDIIWKLRRGIRRARVTEAEVIDAVEEFDTNDSNLITSKQFMKALKGLNIDLSESDILRLMLRFDNEDAQRFDTSLFTRFLTGGKDPAEGTKISKSKRSVDSDGGDVNQSTRTSEAAETRLINALRSRILDNVDIGFTLSEIFAMFDPNGKGSLDLLSLMHGAKELGVALTRAEARNVLRRMSLFAGGIIDKISFFETLDINSKSGKKKKKSRRSDSDDDLLDYHPSDRRLYDDGDEGGALPSAILRIVNDLKEAVRERESDTHSNRYVIYTFAARFRWKWV
jgi:Ca2+-binding EF-hand superfamily protein